MTTAKPEPMAGQSDADDLIAELAKLMAQDARTDTPAPSTPPPAAAQPVAPQPQPTPFPVRIPGGDAPAAASPAPVPRFDFNRPAEAPAAQPAATSRRDPEPAPATPVAPATPASTPVEPKRSDDAFNFDLDFAPKSSPVSSPMPQVAKPAEPAPVAVPPAATPQPPATPVSSDYDSIADLIAAELLADTPAEPEVAPAPVSPPVVAAATPQVGRPVVSGGQVIGQEERAERRPPGFDAPAPKPEGDSFKIPPVFGLGGRPAAGSTSAAPESVAPVPTAEPRVETPPVAEIPAKDGDTLGTDPIDEIENLIGRAVRVDMEPPVQARPAGERPVASPALRSLATPTLQAQPEPAARAPRPVSDVDETILAAAAATGADIGWVEAPDSVEAKPGKRRVKADRAPRAPRSFNFSRALAGPVVAIVLLAAAGLGLYWVLGMGGGESGPPPVLTADATPVKETPAAEPAAASTPQSVVFNEIDGVQPGSEEQLVSRDQADVNEVTQVATPSVSEEGLANRKVRTVTVRPDGTIVSGDETVAGSAMLPVDRPTVPDVPGAETASPELVAAAQPQPEPTPPAQPVTPPVTPVTPGATVPAVDAAGNPIAGKTAVVPRLRPATFAQAAAAAPAAAAPNTVNAIIEAATPPAAAPTPAQQPAPGQPSITVPGATEVEALGNDAPAYVQLASQRSEAEARQTAQAMVNRFGPLFGGANMEVQRVDLGARGIYYRVRVPATSMQSANEMCTQVKAAGGDCFTM